MVSKLLFQSVEREKQRMGCSIYFRHTYFRINWLRLLSLSIDLRGTLGAWTRLLAFEELKWRKIPVASVLMFVLKQVLLSFPRIRVQVYREVLHCLYCNSTTHGPDLFWTPREGSNTAQYLPLTATDQVGHRTANTTMWCRRPFSQSGQSKCTHVCTRCPQKTLLGLVT